MKRSWTFDNAVRLFLYREDDAGDLPEDWRQLASGEERARAGQMASDKRASTFLRARALLRNELAKLLGTAPAGIAIKITPEGRPFLAQPGSNIDFSLSHSENHILIGITEGGKIGVDLQYRNPDTPVEKLAPRFLTPEDYASVAAIADAAARRAAFFKAWCLREARLKLGDIQGAPITETADLLDGDFAYAVCRTAA